MLYFLSPKLQLLCDVHQYLHVELFFTVLFTSLFADRKCFPLKVLRAEQIFTQLARVIKVKKKKQFYPKSHKSLIVS